MVEVKEALGVRSEGVSSPRTRGPPSTKRHAQRSPRLRGDDMWVGFHCARNESADPWGGIGLLTVGQFISQNRRMGVIGERSQKRRPIGAGHAGGMLPA